MLMSFYRFFLLLFVISFFSTSCSSNDTKVSVVKDGFLDLSEWDFEKNGIVSLSGEWEFYWSNFYKSNDFDIDLLPAKSGYIKVPGVWNKYSINENSKVGSFGYATYRLKIRLPDNNESVSFYIYDMKSAFEFYVNGNKEYSVGEIAKNKKEIIPQSLPGITGQINNTTDMEIILHIANYHYYKGGVSSLILLGNPDTISRRYHFNILTDLFLAGISLILFFYHFNFYLINKQKYILYFSLFSLLVFIKVLVSREFYLVKLFSEIDWHFIVRLSNITYVLSMVCAALCIYSFFNEKAFNKIYKGLIYLTILLASVFTFFPFYYIGIFNFLFHLIGVIAIILIFKVLIHGICDKRKFAFLYLSAFIILTLTTIYDVIQLIFFNHGVYLTPLGLIILFFFQAKFMSSKFAITHIDLVRLSSQQERIIEKRSSELKRANEERTAFFINMAHETKTPLTLIKNYLDRYIRNHSYDKSLEIIKNNVDKLLTDMGNYLDVSKLERKQVDFDHNQIINLSDILMASCVLFSEYAKSKNIVLKKTISNNIYIKADPFSMEKIINNLLDNAVKYTKPGGSIEVFLKYQDNDFVEMEIVDNGIGMDEALVKNIFKPYYQLSNKKNQFNGMGMGLFIVKEIADSMKCSIQVNSILHKGSGFKLILAKYNFKSNDIIVNPVAGVSSFVPSSVITEVKEQCFNNNKDYILVVEDNLEMLTLIQSSLMDKYNVHVACNGKEALKKLEKITKPSLIISDLMMPKMDGNQLLAKLMSSKFNDIPFIFLTAKTLEDNKLAALSVGAIDYINKPFNIMELREKVSSILLNRKQSLEKGKKEIYKQLYNYLEKGENNDQSKTDNEKLFNVYNITPKEREVILHICDGLQSKEIASKLNRSTRTIENHLVNIYKKFNVTSRAELIHLIYI